MDGDDSFFEYSNNGLKLLCTQDVKGRAKATPQVDQKCDLTAKSGHRTHNRQHWGEVRTRGTSTSDPCSFRYTNGLLAEFKIQTVYNRNTRRRTIKVYAGIATLAFAREPSAKAKKVQRSRQGSNILPRMRAACTSPLYQSELIEMAVNIRPSRQSC